MKRVAQLSVIGCAAVLLYLAAMPVIVGFETKRMVSGGGTTWLSKEMCLPWWWVAERFRPYYEYSGFCFETTTGEVWPSWGEMRHTQRMGGGG